MRKLIFILPLLFGLYAQAQFPTTDSLRKFNNKYIRNSAIDAFTNLRLNTTLNGIINFVDSTFTVSPAGKLDSVVVSQDTILLNYRGGAVVSRDTIHVQIVGNTNNSSVGAGYKLVQPGTRNVKSITPGAYLIFDSSLSTLNIRIDSGAYSNYLVASRGLVGGLGYNNTGDSLVWNVAGTRYAIPTPSGDSATNAAYGLVKSTTSGIRTFRFDSTTVFPQLRSTIRKTDSVYAKNDSTFSATINGVTFDIPAGRNRLRSDRTVTINGSTQNVANNPVFNISVGGGGTLYGFIDASKVGDTFQVDMSVTTNYRVPFSGTNNYIKVFGGRNGQQVTVATQSQANGSDIVRMTDQPLESDYMQNSGGLTVYTGVFDSTASIVRWSGFTRFPGGVVTIPPPTGSVYTMGDGDHTMTAYTKFYTDRVAYFTMMKNTYGQNMEWVFMENYGSDLRAEGLATMNALQSAGMKGMPGMSNDASTSDIAAMIVEMCNHPAVLRDATGLPIIHAYYYYKPKWDDAVAQAAAAGRARNTYRIYANVLYPNAGLTADYAQTYPINRAGIQRVFNTYGIDGLAPFSGDHGATDVQFRDNQIFEDTAGQNVAYEMGKGFFPGWCPLYKSVQHTELGFTGLDSLFRALISVTPAKRGKYFIQTTQDDFNEDSYGSPVGTSTTNGLAYMPELAVNGFRLGADSKLTPALAHDGILRFLKPYFTALRTGATSLAVTQDAIFYWYPLHSRSVGPTSTIPSALSAYNQPGNVDNAYWNDGRNVFSNQPAWVAAGKLPRYETIRMAAWLTAPAQLRINGTTSGTTYPAGIAFFDIPLASGTPSFAIVRGGVDVLTRTGSQAITGNRWPGGLQYLIE